MEINKLILVVSCVLSVIACKQSTEPYNTLSTDKSGDSINAIIEEQALKGRINERSIKFQKDSLVKEGYQVFEMYDEVSKDTLLMQQYFIAFLKKGPNRNQSEEETKELQIAHLTHLRDMYYKGYADISGPFGDDGDIMGITIYSVPTLNMADSLAKSDPMVKAGRLEIEIHPWWAGKGLKLR